MTKDRAYMIDNYFYFVRRKTFETHLIKNCVQPLVANVSLKRI